MELCVLCHANLEKIQKNGERKGERDTQVLETYMRRVNKFLKVFLGNLPDMAVQHANSRFGRIPTCAGRRACMISDRVATPGLRSLSHLSADGRLLSHSRLKMSERNLWQKFRTGEDEREVFFGGRGWWWGNLMQEEKVASRLIRVASYAV